MGASLSRSSTSCCMKEMNKELSVISQKLFELIVLYVILRKFLEFIDN